MLCCLLQGTNKVVSLRAEPGNLWIWRSLDPVVAEASLGLGLVLVLVSLPIGLASGFVSIEAVLTSSQ